MATDLFLESHAAYPFLVRLLHDAVHDDAGRRAMTSALYLALDEAWSNAGYRERAERLGLRLASEFAAVAAAVTAEMDHRWARQTEGFFHDYVRSARRFWSSRDGSAYTACATGERLYGADAYAHRLVALLYDLSCHSYVVATRPVLAALEPVLGPPRPWRTEADGSGATSGPVSPSPRSGDGDGRGRTAGMHRTQVLTGARRGGCGWSSHD